ncbi:MAG: PocR ligand-binding domain-containing protein [Geobacteraceae bacterium]|nr:PocR ligand-binding domain-containing protein [Geobacteraceae bacterium]
MMINYSFSELVNIDELRSLCEQFTKLTGFVTAILDMEGHVLVATGWQEICTRFHRSAPGSALRCRESDMILASRLQAGERYSVYRCGNGLIDVVVPIVIDGEQVGRLYSGQFLFEPPDMEFFRRQAAEMGFDEPSYLDAVKKVRVVTEDQARLAMDFLCRLSEMIGSMGLTNRRVDDAVIIVKDSPAVLFRCKATEGRPVRYVSDNVIQFGYAPGWLMSGNVLYSSLVYSEDLQRIASEVAEYSRLGIDRFQLEYRIVTRAGEVRWVDERAVAERDVAGNIVHYRSVVLDITEAKKVEEALRDSEERLKMAMDLAKLAKWEYDVESGMFFFDEQFYSLYGTTTEQEGGSLMSAEEYARKFLHPEDSPLVAAEIEKALATDDPNFSTQVEHRIIRADGEERFIVVRYMVVCDRAGRVIKTRGVNQDITERRKAEMEIRESNERLRVAFETIPDYISISTLEDGVFVDVNPGFTKIVGYTRDEVIGKSALDLDLWIDPGNRWQFLDTIRKNGSVNNIENKYRHKDGRVIDVSMYASIIKLDNKPYMFGFLKDITEVRKSEEDRKILEAQLQQAQKMEAIGQLAGGIAHDFNNILTAIIGYAEIISIRIDRESPILHFIEQVLASSGRAADLVNSLLAFSRKQVLHPKPVDLCEIVQGLKKMLGRIIREDIDFMTVVAEKGLIVMADQGQIEQVLMNLVTNARDAMPQGGTLSVDVFQASIDKGFVQVHGFGEPGHYACITVTDTGCGMDAETQKKIFEPFYTTKEVGKGTGLGMAIIYGIVKQHNGYINVYSEPGNGTVFRVYLPLLAEEKHAVHKTENNKPPKGGSETILLAEDDITVRELHKILLEEAGYKVVEAFDGHDALAKFMENRPTIDLLATDVIMPRIDGKSLYQEIRKFRPDMKVLFISGYTKDIVIEKGIPGDGANFISKPVTSSILLTKVREILDLMRTSEGS